MLIWTRDGDGEETAKKKKKTPKEMMDGLKGAGWHRGSVGFWSPVAARLAPDASTFPLKPAACADLDLNTRLSCSRAQPTSSSVPLLAC